jgi:SET domain-containing protein
MPPKINPDYWWYKVRLVKSTIHGWGVVADQNIPKNKWVAEYTGKLLNRREHCKIAKRKMIYTYAVGERGYWTLDGFIGGSGAERVNHSCDPNLAADIRGKRVYFFSLRRIKKGEELTVDYHFEENNGITCLCGSKKCRGKI